jgi:hypothetical protein
MSSPTSLVFDTNVTGVDFFQLFIVDAASGIGSLVGSVNTSSVISLLPFTSLPPVGSCRVCVAPSFGSQFIQVSALPGTQVYWPSGAAPQYVCQVTLSGTVLSLFFQTAA